MATFDHEVTLVTVDHKDAYDYEGNPIKSEILLPLMCDVSSVTRNEYYTAGTDRMKPEYVVTIHPFEYENQSEVILDGRRMDILRTYRTSDGLLELTVGEKIGER